MTTYSTSTIQRYSDALIAALKAALPGTIVVDGPPPVALRQIDIGAVVWLGDVEGSQDFRALGNANRPKSEEYTITTYISCVSPTTPDDTEVQNALSKQAFSLLAKIEQLLRANPTLGLNNVTPSDAAGGYVIYSEVRRPIKLSKRGNDQARESSIEFGVYVKAHL